MSWQRRALILLAAAWLGLLLSVALIATPAPFATLDKALAGRVVARVLAHEAAASVVLGALTLALLRWETRRRFEAGQPVRQFDLQLGLAGAALFCTVAGYYGVQPMMEQARAGQGSLGFGALHAISVAFFGLKAVLVAALAWALTRPSSS
ncbi:MAG: DUF4149 domain-containing protein [Rubrivivax sp.]|nr:DUF4149 domain-containing protein [Rubrivivax sp.]